MKIFNFIKEHPPNSWREKGAREAPIPSLGQADVSTLVFFGFRGTHYSTRKAASALGYEVRPFSWTGGGRSSGRRQLGLDLSAGKV